MKEDELGWAGHVLHMGRREMPTYILLGNLKEGDCLEDPKDERIILMCNIQTMYQSKIHFDLYVSQFQNHTIPKAHTEELYELENELYV
jgi:hypothetical protein